MAYGAVKPRACAVILREIGSANGMPEYLDVAVVGGARRGSKSRIYMQQCYAPKL